MAKAEPIKVDPVLATPKTLLLGLGNILCGDEGIGCRVAEYLYQDLVFPDYVRIADGGTMGQELLEPVMLADNLLIIDCADFGLEPGQTLLRENSAVPIWLGVNKMSPHQGGFAEVLALAKLKDSLPSRIALLAIQPQSLGFGDKLSPLLRGRIHRYASLARDVLEGWGIVSVKRRKPEFLSDTPVALQNYEPEALELQNRNSIHD